MPKKPNKTTLEACKKNLDPVELVLTIINETPELRQDALDAKIVREVTQTERN